MTQAEIDQMCVALNERTSGLTLESWELWWTGGNCRAIGLHSKRFEVILTEEGTLPESIDGPWMVGVYRLDANGDNIDDGEIVAEGETLCNALNAVVKALRQQLREEVQR